MKISRKFFSKKVEKEESEEDLLKITKIIGPLIDSTANEIFAAYNTKLLNEPVTYIVPAVWGAKKDGELTATQKEMNRQIAPVIRQILDSLQLKGLTGAQEFAIGFLIRGLIISKTCHMIEMVKNRGANKTDSGQQSKYGLEHLEPIGTA